MRSRRPINSTHARVITVFALVGLLIAAAACDREPGEAPSGPQLIPTVGGQSGQEGSCLLQPVDALRFDAEATLGSVIGRHETKLRWNTRDEGSRVADGRSGLERAIFEISARGSAHIEPEVKLECGGSAFLDVDVHMQVPASDLDVTFEAVAQAWGADGVTLSTTFDRAFRSSVTGRAKKLADDLVGFAPSTAEEEYYFDMWLFRGFASGQLIGRHGDAFCGLALWPETYCDDGRVAMPAKDALGELDATELFDAISGIGEKSLEWSDGRSMRIRFEIEPDSGAVCAGPYFPRTLGDTLNGTEIELPVRVRAISDDGALDITVPGSVLAVISAEHSFTGRVRLEASAFTSRPGVAAGRVPVEAPMPGRALSVSLQAQHDADGDFMWLSVMSSVVDEAVAEVSPRDDASRVLICSGAPQTTSTIDVLLDGVYGIQR